MANTEIEYFYRDKGNYKQHERVVLKGSLDGKQFDEFEKCLVDANGMDRCFLAEEVGLDDLRGMMGDHGPWHELSSALWTDERPTSTMTARGFLARLKAIAPKMAKLAEKMEAGEYESDEENGALRRNTLLSYSYRDGSNNMTSRDVIIEGEITDAQRAVLIELLDRGVDVDTDGRIGDFIPGQVGLPDLQDDFPSKGAWTDNDHPWHMLETIRQTSLPADDDVPSLAEVMAKLSDLMATKASGAEHIWDEEYRPAFHAEMVAREAPAPGM